MKIILTKDEQTVVTGLIYMLQHAAVKTEDRDSFRFLKRLANKIDGNRAYCELKNKELKNIIKTLEVSLDAQEKSLGANNGKPLFADGDTVIIRSLAERLNQKLDSITVN